jgi:hypothetical protein
MVGRGLFTVVNEIVKYAQVMTWHIFEIVVSIVGTEASLTLFLLKGTQHNLHILDFDFVARRHGGIGSEVASEVSETLVPIKACRPMRIFDRLPHMRNRPQYHLPWSTPPESQV